MKERRGMVRRRGGAALVRTGRRVLGLLVLVLAVTLPGVESPWDRLGAALDLADHEPGAARQALEDLLADQPDFAAAHYDLGCLLAEADDEAAARHFSSATASRDDQLAARSWHNLALCRYRQGRLEEAVSAAEQALRRCPGDEGYQRNHEALRTIHLRRQDAARLAAEEAAKRLRLVDEPLPPAWEGEAWEARLGAVGGSGGPYRYTLGEGVTLPEGLALDAEGTLRGSPAAGSSGGEPDGHAVAVGVVVADGVGTAQGTATLRLLPPPTILLPPLPEAIQGLSYAASIASSGFIRPTWTITGLPAGLRCEASGQRARIVGTPERAGSFPLEIVVADAHHRQEQRVALTVAADGFAPAEEYLTDATQWQAYEHRCSVRGRGGPFRWSSPGAGGLQIDASGLLHGTPQQSGPLTVPVVIHAADGRSRPATLHLTVHPPPVITEEEAIVLPTARLADRQLRATGGTRPLRWQLVVGAQAVLPDGLAFSEDGRLHGVPRQAGETTLAVRLEDRWGAVTQSEITVQVQDQQDDQQDDEQEEQGGQQQGEQGEQQQQGEQGEQQQQQGEQGEQQQQQGEQGEQQQQQGEQQQGGQEGEQQQAELAQGADEAPDLQERSADRYLEDLPQGDGGLRLFMLLDEEAASTARRYRGDPW